MANQTVNLVELLQRQRLLKPAQLAELAGLESRFPQPPELAKELVRRGWLTPFQGRQILAGRADRLVLGPYQLLDQLGAGGSGNVFKARHQNMDRVVALKILRGDLLEDADAVGRFYREVEVISQLSHPAIVHAYDAGVVGGTHFLAMEFVEGIDLDRQVKESGPLPPFVAADFIRQAAAGMQYAHERGLIHRDIKPSNLLVTGWRLADGGLPMGKSDSAIRAASSKSTFHNAPAAVVKILDLGLARLREPAAGSRTGNLTALAGNSVMMGTPDYMAPEQALDFHTADIRADVYSLGCTFHYLLTGRPPFSGSLTQKLAKHQQGEIPPVPALEKLPGLAEVLRKMLAKRAADRYQTPGEVAQALARAAGGGGAQASDPDTAYEVRTFPDRTFALPHRYRRPALIAAGLLLLIGLAWLGLRLATEPAAVPPRQVLQFNGKDQVVILPDDLFRKSPNLTVEAWFKTAGHGAILGYQNQPYPATPGSYVPVMSVGPDGRLRAEFWDGTVNPVVSPAPVNDDRWHHACLTVDGQAQALYLDGQPVASRKSNPINHLDMTKNHLGAAFTGGWPGGNGKWLYFAGQVAELRVWHVARKPEEVQAAKDRLLIGPPGLAAYYPMLEATGDELRDYSGNGRHAKLGGGDPNRKPAWTTLPAEEAPSRTGGWSW